MSEVRIAHVNLARGFRGGERQTQLLIEALSQLEVRQVLVARYDSPLLQKLRGIPQLDFYPVGKPYWKHISGLRALQTDLLHAHDAKAAQWSLLNHCFNRTPYLITRRMDRPPRNSFFTRTVYRKAAAVAALSRAARDGLRKLAPDRDVIIIPSMYASLPADARRVAELRRKYSGRFIIGHAGALVDRHKGQAVLIRAAQLLRNRYPEFTFLLLGEGADRAALQRLAGTDSSIEFIGFVEDIGSWIEAFDLFVFPSREEGLGSTLLDVMQHRKPIVASAVGGIPDIVRDGYSGLLVPAGDAERLAAALERMYLDSALREKCVTGALEQLERYSPRYIAGCYHNLYQTILNSAV